MTYKMDQMTDRCVNYERDHRITETKEKAKYWRDIAECVCDKPDPIGACLHCDMNQIIELLTQG